MSREDILDVIADLYQEYEISEFGFDLIELIKKMEINIVPYSSFSKEKQNVLKNYDEDGFNVINPNNNKIEIYYNDFIKPKRRISFTLPHELGHICLGHNYRLGNETKLQKNDANLFANEFYCPQAFMINYNLITVSDLISTFNITDGYAKVLLEKLNKRRDKSLSYNEERLIKTFEYNKRKKS